MELNPTLTVNEIVANPLNMCYEKWLVTRCLTILGTCTTNVISRVIHNDTLHSMIKAAKLKWQIYFLGYLTIDSLYPRSTTMYVDKPASYNRSLNEIKTMNALNASTFRDGESLGDKQKTSGLGVVEQTKSPQELAGINMEYPGRTEYMSRYKPQMEQTYNNYIINPKPDLLRYGRPLGETEFTPLSTEYEFRFEWPNGTKMAKLPWLRN